MAQFVAFDPKVEVLGQSMLGIFTVMGEAVKPLLVKHGLTDIKPEGWYPIQPYLDVYRDIFLNRQGKINLVNVGMKVPENAVFPPEIDSIDKAMLVLDEAYHLNHRGGEIGHYHAKVVNSRRIDIIAETPFPCDLDIGIVRGLAYRFRPPKSDLAVYHDLDSPCRKNGSDRCIYHVTW